MANEVTVNLTLAYKDANGTAETLQLANAVDSVGSLLVQRGTMAVPTSATALPLGNVVTPGWLMIVNKDPTNFVQVLTGTGAKNMQKIKAGKAGLIYCGTDVTAPFVQANSAIVQIDYLLISQ